MFVVNFIIILIIFEMLLYLFTRQQSHIQMTESVTQEALLHSNIHNASIAEGESFFGLFMFLKIVFYLIFIVKIIELSFLRRRKYTLKERIYRKFLFAHQELLRNFTDQDKSIMETTLTNTIKNASIEFNPNNSRIRRPIKKVSFQTDRNSYYDPKSQKQESIFAGPLNKRTETSSEDEKTSFEQKKLEDQFVQREDLLGLNKEQEDLLPLESKITQNNQEAMLSQQSMSSNIINAEIDF